MNYKECFVYLIERDLKLFNSFNGYCKIQELDADFILYEDDARYFKKILVGFTKYLNNKKRGLLK